MLVVVTGGSGSGKSAFAEETVLSFGEARRIYIACGFLRQRACSTAAPEGAWKGSDHPRRHVPGRGNRSCGTVSDDGSVLCSI